MTKEEKHQAEEQNKLEFINSFRNTNLEDYAGEIYDWYVEAKLPDQFGELLSKDKLSIESMIRHCHELIIMLGDLRRHEVRWRNEIITDLLNSPENERMIQKALISFIGETQYIVGTSLSSDPRVSDAIRRKWGEALEWMPLTASLEYDEDGLFTQESFDYAYTRIERCYKESQALFELTNMILMKEFLKFVKSLGADMCNKTYRQEYRCLEYFGWLPEETAKSHQNTPAKYVKENYIKSHYRDLEKYDFCWDDFITDSIERDRLSSDENGDTLSSDDFTLAL